MFYHNARNGRNGLVYYIFTILLTFLGYFIGQIPMFLVMFSRMNHYNDIGKDDLARFNENPDFTIFHIDRNLGMVLVLMTFVVAFAFLLLAVKYIHKRSIVSLFSTDGKIDLRRFAWGFALWFGLLIVAELVFYAFAPDNYIFHRPGMSFFILLIIAITLLPIQVTFEEVFTRGYIYQAVSYYTNNVFIGFLVSVIIFAALHSFNPETIKYGLLPMMTYYISAGILLGLVVIFDDRLELAIGIHYATNVFGALILTYEGAAMQTDALFTARSINPKLLAVEMIVLGLIFLFLAYRKYHWNISKLKFNK